MSSDSSPVSPCSVEQTLAKTSAPSFPEDRDSGSITLRYKTPAGRAGLFVLAALTPLWLFWVPFALSVGAASWTGDLQMRWLLALAAMTFPLVALTLWACLDSAVVIDSHAVRFPVRFRLHSWLRPRLRWSDLRAVIYRPNKDESRSQLLLKFKQGTVPLSVGGFTKDDLRKLVLATQTHCTKASELIGVQTPSFTEIWEKEYESRFAPTVFVPLEPGTELQSGRIQILGQTATGGLSAIYLARTSEGKKVVVKEAVAPSHAPDQIREKALELFQREARLLKQLNHPRISHVLDHFSEDGRHYLVMEHIAGIDLRRFIQDNGRQHEEIALRWAMEITDVLLYLHSRVPPVLHRDLTPDNLIFTANGAIAVIDFGAANAFVAQATGTLVGKQSYISPEQFRGRATPQSDLYSLGCTLHFLLTGIDPEPMSVSHPRELNAEVSAITDALVARCTALEAGDRVESAQMLLANLRGTIANLRRSASKVGVGHG